MYCKNLLLPLVLSSCVILTGCGAAVVGGVAAGGYKGITDERSVGTMVDDSVISTSVKTRMISDKFVKSRHIDVDVLNGVVYLIGAVESPSQKKMATNIAMGVDGVRRVENQLIVSGTTVGQSLNDIIFTSKLKVHLLKHPDIRSTNIDVDTNNNIVTLTGIVGSQKEKNTTLSIAQRVADGRRIVDNLRVGN